MVSTRRPEIELSWLSTSSPGAVWLSHETGIGDSPLAQPRSGTRSGAAILEQVVPGGQLRDPGGLTPEAGSGESVRCITIGVIELARFGGGRRSVGRLATEARVRANGRNPGRPWLRLSKSHLGRGPGRIGRARTTPSPLSSVGAHSPVASRRPGRLTRNPR